MKYSIVVPTHNRPERLSIIEKMFENLNSSEIIFIENNSSKENLYKYKKHKFSLASSSLYSFSNNEIAVGEARNRGLKIAKGDYIFFFDDDDTITDEFISFLNKSNLSENIYRCSYKINNLRRRPGYGKKVSKLTMFDTVQPSTFLCSRVFLMANNIYFEENVVHQDNHFAALILQTGSDQWILDVVSMEYNTSNESIQRSKKSIKKEFDSIKSFNNDKYTLGNIFIFKLILSTNEFRKKGLFIVDDKIITNNLKEQFLKIKSVHTFKGLPMFYKFLYIKWFLKTL